MNLAIRFWCVAWLSLWSLTAGAQVRLPQVFGDHMVLQRDQPLPIWGWAQPRERVTVRLAGQEVRTRAGQDGRWRVDLAPLPAGGPHELVVSGRRDALLLEDVLIGEVWICSGQSNMEWPMTRINDSEAEIAAAHFPEIRLFDVPHHLQPAPVEDLPAGLSWQACSPASVASFSAVGYFFGRKLHQELGVPIGLISTNWGGTEVETWTSREAMATVPAFAQELEAISATSIEDMQTKLKAKYETLLARFGPVDGPEQDGKLRWADPAYAAPNWQEMAVPGLWEQRGLESLDGEVWFRYAFDVPAAVAARGGSLSLGPIDDSDVTWINGQQVGTTLDAYDLPRTYAVPAGLLKAGRNVLVVKVIDTGGGGGIWGQPDQLVFQSEGFELPLAGTWHYRIDPAQMRLTEGGIRPNDYPTLLYNGMVHPLIPYAMQGAIWYQGESNASRAHQYRTLFPLMIQDWRGRWERDFPFLWVQLANFKAAQPEPGPSDWAELREAQSLTLSLPHTAEAVIIDIGEAGDIHPRNKQDVGYRLALGALKVAYGQDLVFSGPRYRSHRVLGDRIELTFDHVGSGMVARDRYGYLKGFAIAGADREFHWAQARITGPTTIEVSCPDVKAPVSVRYGWADNPEDVNLYNAEGLPASPFRTDDWPGITVGRE